MAAKKKPPAAPKDYTTYSSKREAIKSTEFESLDACVVEWLQDYSDGRVELRRRFSHRLSNADGNAIAAGKLMVRAIVRAFVDNDPEKLAWVEQLFRESVGLSDKQEAVVSAHNELSAHLGLRRGSEGMDGTHVAALVKFMLQTTDKRFLQLSDEAVAGVLLRAKPSAAGKGGAGRQATRGTLAELIAMSGAFDVKPGDKETARKLVNNAVRKSEEKAAAAKKKRSRATTKKKAKPGPTGRKAKQTTRAPKRSTRNK